MIRIAAVDDNPHDLQLLQNYLKTYKENSKESFRISCFSDGKELLTDYRPVFDIILMDIEMAQIDGMTAAEEIRRTDKNVVIIFLTNMPQYAIKGYAVEALDYILKPVSYYAFSQCLERALKRRQKRREAFLNISTGKGALQKISFSSVYYIEIQGHTLFYHTTEGTLSAAGSIREVEQQVDDRFFRCNKCYLVNLEHVASLKGGFAVVGGEEVQISRAKRKAFLDALNNYLKEVAK